MTCGTGSGTFPLPGDPDLNTIVLSAQTVLNGVAVSWTYPALLGHGVAHTIIYRSTGSLFGGAVEHRIISGNYFFDLITPATETTYYYWIRLVSIQGTVGDPVGPASAIVGAGASSMLALFSDAINESALNVELRGKIANILTVDGRLTAEEGYRLAGEEAIADLYASLSDDMAGLDTFLGAETIARVDADSALVASVNLAYAMYDDNAAAILAEQIVRASADGALATSITTLDARLFVEVDPADLLPVSPAGAYATFAALDAAVPAATADVRKYYRVVDPLDALAEILYRSNGSAWASVGTEQHAKLEQAMRVTASKTKGLSAQYTLKVSAGKAIAGFGIAATEVDGVPESIFIVQADTFALTTPYDYTQESAPTATAIGETWYKESTKISYRSTGTGTGNWVVFTPVVPFGVDTVSGEVYIANSLRLGGGTGPTVTSTTAALTNFNARNDRIATAVVTPTIATDGSAVDHTVNTDGSVNLSFEWAWAGTNVDIDGWVVVIYSSAAGTAYTIGTTPTSEARYVIPADRRAFILHGAAADLHYTFGLQAYRAVDPDVHASGLISSTLISPTLGAENPYQPASTVSYAGDVTGTISGASALSVAVNSGLGASAYSDVTSGTIGLGTKMGLASKNVLSGVGGFKVGTIDWDAAGTVTAGNYGVAITAKGIVARNAAGADTFVLDATTGKATFKDDIETAGRVIATGGETYSGVLAAMHAIAGSVGGVGLYGSSGLYGNAGVDGNTDDAVGTRGAATAAGGIGVLAVGTGGAAALSIYGPMVINNSTKVDLLNADLLDGNTAADFSPLLHTHWIEHIYQSSGATDGSDTHVAKFQYSTVDPHTGPWTNFYLRRVNW